MVTAPAESAPLILLVDDSEDNRDVYAMYLRHQGWRVAIAVDGVEGLTLAMRLHPNVIILDLGLPGIDGWEVAIRLKNAPDTSAIPIIAVSGHVTKESRQRARDAGVNEFVSKPCLPADLVAAIRRHLRRTAPAPAAPTPERQSP
jgi:two-component system, cell cycle response regulator DivK